MGFHATTYVGPIFKIKYFDVKNKFNVNTCSRLECSNNIKNKELNCNFCSLCGSEVTIKIYEKVQQKDLYNIEADVDIFNYIFDVFQHTRNLESKDDLILIPNYTVPNSLYIDENEPFSINPLEYITEEKLTNFKNMEDTIKVIEILNNNFGESNISIEFSFLTYLS